MRGKRRFGNSSRGCAGSIPARAGETIVLPRWRVAAAVHPRACGGNCPFSRHLNGDSGPSPRVRGKPRGLHSDDPLGGSIPARAGETEALAALADGEEVHPRACGGNRDAGISAVFPNGPSPRVRGKRRFGNSSRGCAGSIPARAGETIVLPRWRVAAAVHPRACGGNPEDCTLTIRWEGPSPRVRGKPKRSLLLQTVRRSIPARAGETSANKHLEGRRAVHPRACGGNAGIRMRLWQQSGPSPRVRGKQDRGKELSLGRRSIPARAGETRRTHPGERP